MTRSIDQAILIGFVDEVRSYLPAITEGIGSLCENPGQPEVMEEAHCYVHTIKGAASMVGLAGLSHIAYYLEETLEGIAAGQLAMDDETAAFLSTTVTQIQNYLDGMVKSKGFTHLIGNIVSVFCPIDLRAFHKEKETIFIFFKDLERFCCHLWQGWFLSPVVFCRINPEHFRSFSFWGEKPKNLFCPLCNCTIQFLFSINDFIPIILSLSNEVAESATLVCLFASGIEMIQSTPQYDVHFCELNILPGDFFLAIPR